MNDEKLLHYTQLFLKLRRASRFGGAPHKPVLLLAIINLVKRGEITSHRIQITFELVLEFKEIWARIVETPHIANFALPFYHMQSEPFWRLIPKTQYEIPITSSKSIRSLRALQETLAFAEIDIELFYLLRHKENSIILQQFLLDKYFPFTKGKFYTEENTIFSKMETQILMEDRQQYAERIETLRHYLSAEEFQEEIFVRGGISSAKFPRSMISVVQFQACASFQCQISR